MLSVCVQSGYENAWRSMALDPSCHSGILYACSLCFRQWRTSIFTSVLSQIQLPTLLLSLKKMGSGQDKCLPEELFLLKSLQQSQENLSLIQIL